MMYFHNYFDETSICIPTLSRFTDSKLHDNNLVLITITDQYRTYSFFSNRAKNASRAFRVSSVDVGCRMAAAGGPV